MSICRLAVFFCGFLNKKGQPQTGRVTGQLGPSIAGEARPTAPDFAAVSGPKFWAACLMRFSGSKRHIAKPSLPPVSKRKSAVRSYLKLISLRSLTPQQFNMEPTNRSPSSGEIIFVFPPCKFAGCCKRIR